MDRHRDMGDASKRKVLEKIHGACTKITARHISVVSWSIWVDRRAEVYLCDFLKKNHKVKWKVHKISILSFIIKSKKQTKHTKDSPFFYKAQGPS